MTLCTLVCMYPYRTTRTGRGGEWAQHSPYMEKRARLAYGSRLRSGVRLDFQRVRLNLVNFRLGQCLD